MKKTILSGIMLTLLLVGIATLAFNIVPVKSGYIWTETIYIRANGSVEPVTAPIFSSDNITYVLTDHIFGAVPQYTSAIVVERDNIVVEGASFTLQGTGSGTGIDLNYRNNVTLKNLKVTTFSYGIYLNSSSYNVLAGNTASNNVKTGFFLGFSSHNALTGNTASNNWGGIHLFSSSHNNLTGNTASNNTNEGIYLGHSSSNVLTGNTASNMRDIGIDLYFSSNNVIANNTASNNGGGIHLFSSSHNNLTGNTASNNEYGISLSHSSSNVLTGNTVSNTNEGIFLGSSSSNVLTGNTVSNTSLYGINLWDSSDNDLVNNTASNNEYGILLSGSNNNTLFHNNLINNTKQVTNYFSMNTWDDGYPSGGNYWSDYIDVDQYSGPNQDGLGSDGIWDHSYVIDENNQDNYPIVPEFPSFLILSLFIIATLAMVIFAKKRKRDREISS